MKLVQTTGPITLAPLKPGSRIGPYEVVGHLATGGMGEVYLARKRGIGGFERSVVLKVMLAHLAHDERFSRMFIDEARIVSGLSHPNIVQVYDLDRAESGALYLAMEHLRGHSVAALLRDSAKSTRPIPVAMAARVVCDAASGLAFAHAASDRKGEALGLVHRDISPENLITTYAGPTKVLDFGVAKVKDSYDKTQHGEFKGKVGYMAPEVIRGGVAEPRADIFSLGVVLFELLTTRRLFHTGNPASSLHRVLNAPLPDVRELRPEVEAPIASLVAKMLDRDADRRMSSAEQVAERLERWLAPKSATPKHAGRWLRDRFKEAHQISERIDEGLERTGQIDQTHLAQIRKLGGEELADTLVREVSEQYPEMRGPTSRPRARLLSEFESVDVDAEVESSEWITRGKTLRWVFGVAAVLVGLGAAGYAFKNMETGHARIAGHAIASDVLLSPSLEIYTLATEHKQSPAQLVRTYVGSYAADVAAARTRAKADLLRLGYRAVPVPDGTSVDGHWVIDVHTLSPGRPLTTALEKEHFTGKHGRGWALSLSDSMSIAHEGGLTHGNFDLHSLWLTHDGVLQVLGFQAAGGAAHRLSDGSRAPELQNGQPNTHSADQYALGMVIREILRRLDHPSSVKAAPVLARTLAVDPRERFASVRAFRDELAKRLKKKKRR